MIDYSHTIMSKEDRQQTERLSKKLQELEDHLKPCPFCGKDTVKVVPFKNNKFIISHWHTNIFDCPIASSDEDTGIGTTYFETEEEAIETWNKRY